MIIDPPLAVINYHTGARSNGKRYHGPSWRIWTNSNLVHDSWWSKESACYLSSTIIHYHNRTPYDRGFTPGQAVYLATMSAKKKLKWVSSVTLTSLSIGFEALQRRQANIINWVIQWISFNKTHYAIRWTVIYTVYSVIYPSQNPGPTVLL